MSGYGPAPHAIPKKEIAHEAFDGRDAARHVFDGRPERRKQIILDIVEDSGHGYLRIIRDVRREKCG